MFAEISDKIPSLAAIWFVGLLATVAVYALCRLHKSAAFFLLPLCLWLMWEIHYEFFTDIRSAIIKELGVGYLIQLGLIASLSALVALFFVVRTLRKKFRFKAMYPGA